MSRSLHRLIIVLTAAIIVISCGIIANADTSVWDGTCTQPTKYENINGVIYYDIYTASELAYIAQNSTCSGNVKYILKNDLILNEEPIEYENGEVKNGEQLLKWKSSGFSGLLDGNNHTISRLYVDNRGEDTKSSSSFAGLFKMMNDGSLIRNLTIVDSVVIGYDRVGGFAGDVDLGKIYSCSFSGYVKGNDNVGGIAGLYYNNSSISNCTNYGDITGHNSVGGIIGSASRWLGTSECINRGKITGYEYVGGIVGRGSGFGANYGSVSGTKFVAGLSGYGSAGGSNFGEITGKEYVGGLAGIINSSISGYNAGIVKGSSYVGGLCGRLNTSTISQAYNVGQVSGNSNVGAAIGYISLEGCTIRDTIYYLKTDSVNSKLTGFGSLEDSDGIVEEDTEACFPICGNPNANGSYGNLKYMCTITYELNDGLLESEGSKKIRLGSNLGTLPIPSKEENEFDGWTYNEYGTNYAKSTDLVNKKNITLYAKWTDKHIHNFIKTNSKKEDCIHDGNVEYYTCTKCGKHYLELDGQNEVSSNDVVVTATGHNIQLVKAKEPTCANNGNIKYWKCLNCDEFYYDSEGVNVIENHSEVEIETVGHNWSSIKVVDKNPTCDEPGLKSIHCRFCDAIKEGSTEDIEATGHSYGSWETTNEATCTEKGSKHRTCSTCKHEEVAEIEATGHKWKKTYSIDKEATCTEEGSQSIHCSVCDTVKEDSVQEIEKVNHVYAEFVVEPTCSQKGYTLHVCKCGDSYKDSEVNAKNHDFGEWKEISSSTCTTEGAEQRKCKDCGYTETRGIKKKDHNFSQEYTVDKEATCTTDGSKSRHCNDCDAITDSKVIKANGHKYSEWNETVLTTCTTDGQAERTCSVCKDKETITLKAFGHTWNELYTVDQPATCMATGTESIHCARCDESKEGSEKTISKGEHSNIQKTEARSPNCTNDGNIEYWTCGECGKHFSDEDCKTEITDSDIIIKSNGQHSPTVVNAYGAGCTTNGYSGDTVCATCGTVLGRGYVIGAHGHAIVKVGKVNPTCCSDGYKAHYACPYCGLCYKDKKGKKTCALSKFRIKKKKHSYTKKIVAPQYLKSAATTKKPAYYRKACKWCGAAGKATFKYGKKLS